MDGMSNHEKRNDESKRKEMGANCNTHLLGSWSIDRVAPMSGNSECLTSMVSLHFVLLIGI